MTAYLMTTQQQVRTAFWRDHPECQRLRKTGQQNNQLVGVRSAFADYVDDLARSDTISEALAWRVTL